MPVIVRWRVDAMRPNLHNGELFPDSLSPAGIARMTGELSAHGQEQPIQVRSDGTIINGERRWRGARALRWTEVSAVVEEVPDDQILERILGSCSASRQPTLREKVNVYSAILEQLKMTCGRPRGRPGPKTIPSGNILMSPPMIKQQAATRAMFDSPTQAERALAVYTRGDPTLQDAVSLGDMALTAAYDALPKRPKATRAASEETRGSIPATKLLLTPVEAPSTLSEETGKAAPGLNVVAEVQTPIDLVQQQEETLNVVRPSPTAAREAPPRNDPEALEVPGAGRKKSGTSTDELRRSPGGFVSKAAGPGVSQHPLTDPDSNVCENPFSCLLDVPSDEHGCRGEQLAGDEDGGERANATAGADANEPSAFDLALDVIDERIGVLAADRIHEAIAARDMIVSRLDATIANRALPTGPGARLDGPSQTIGHMADSQGADVVATTMAAHQENGGSSKATTGRRMQSSRKGAVAGPTDADVDAILYPWRKSK